MGNPDRAEALRLTNDLMGRGARLIPITPKKRPEALTKGAALYTGRQVPTDRERVFRERVGGDDGEVVREGDYSAEEMVDRLLGGGSVGLYCATVDSGLCVVDYDEGEGSARAWTELMGTPLAFVRSGKRGYHAWFRRPASWGKEATLLQKTASRLPGLTGARDPVKAELICRGIIKVCRVEDLVEVARGVLDNPLGHGAIAEDVMEVVRQCKVEPKPSPLRDTLFALGAAGPKERYETFSSTVPGAWQGDLRQCGPDGFVCKAFVECTMSGPPGDSNTRHTVETYARDIGRKRKEEWDEVHRFFDPGGVPTKVARGALSVKPEVRKRLRENRAGLETALCGMGVKVGRDRFGRKQFRLDFGRGAKGSDGVWEVMSNTNVSRLAGRMACLFCTDSEGHDDWCMDGRSFLNALRDMASAEQREIDPLGDYFRELDKGGRVAWDDSARERLLSLPFELWDFETAPDIVAWAFRAVVCAVVSRHAEPGCKFDHVLVLKGPQGIGKSSFVRALLPGGRALGRLVGKCDLQLLREMGGDKRLIEHTVGKFLCEIPEMKGAADLEKVKAFITDCVDETRMAYDSDSLEMDRTAVFVATTNRDTPIRYDPTGNRRYLPVGMGGMRSSLLSSDTSTYNALWRLMDGSLRDEWWRLALAAVRAEEPNLLDPTPEMEARMAEEVRGFESTSALRDDVGTMLRGVRNASGEGWRVPFLPEKHLSEHLGMRTSDRWTLRAAMQAHGWRHVEKMSFWGVGVDGSQSQMCLHGYHPKESPPVEGEQWRVPVELLVRLLTHGSDKGVPLGDREWEALSAPSKPGHRTIQPPPDL